MSSLSYTKPLRLIVACSSNRVIGRETRLPWHIPEDHQWFHDWTRHQVLILGRICYETWPRAHEDGRRLIVITSKAPGELRPQPIPAGALPPILARNVPEALRIAQEMPGDIFVCGGQRIFEETLPKARFLFLTEVHAEVPGDVHFPDWRHLSWKTHYKRDSADSQYRYTLQILERTAFD